HRHILHSFPTRRSSDLFGQMKIQSPFTKNLSLKEQFQKWTYIVFYLCVAVSLITGLFIELGPKEFKKTMEGIHVLGIYYLLAFIDRKSTRLNSSHVKIS